MTDIKGLRSTWDRLGGQNAFWAVLSDKNEWDKAEFFATGREEIRQVLNVLKKHEITPTFGRALDFGCGVGRLSQALGKHFDSVLGVDIADSMIKQATELNRHKNVHFKQITTGDLSPLKNDSFDFVFTDIVLQHMENKYALHYLEEMHRILKRQGLLIFQLPSTPKNTWKGLLIKGLPSNILTLLRKGMEMHPIHRTQMLERLRKIGFEIITVERDANHKHWHAYFYYARKV